jgi:hypothetical protein
MLSRVGLFRNLPNLDTPTRYYIYKQQPERSSLRCFNLLLHQRHLVPTVTMRSSFITSLLSVVTAVYGYADPMGCSGVCTNAHDPALIRRDDGTYYRFSTGGKIAIHTAPTIVGPCGFHHQHQRQERSLGKSCAAAGASTEQAY